MKKQILLFLIIGVAVDIILYASYARANCRNDGAVDFAFVILMNSIFALLGIIIMYLSWKNKRTRNPVGEMYKATIIRMAGVLIPLFLYLYLSPHKVSMTSILLVMILYVFYVFMEKFFIIKALRSVGTK